MSTSAEFAVVTNAINGLTKITAYTDSGMQDVIDVSLDLAENEGNEDNLKELEEVMAEYINIEADFKAFTEAVNAVKQELCQLEGQDIPDIDKLIKDKTDAMFTSPDVDDHKKMKELRQRLRQIQQDPVDEPSTATQGNDDDDLTMTQSDVITKCPITMVEMSNPVQNKNCKHNYEREAIQSMMRQKSNTRCPVAGCKNNSIIQVKHLIENTELQAYIQRKNRQAKKKK